MFNQLIISKFACRYITNNIKWINMDNKWTKVQEHPVLECGVMTKEDGQVKVTALFKSNNSTIMVYNKEDNYVFMRTEGGMNWYPIHSVPMEIIQQLC